MRDGEEDLELSDSVEWYDDHADETVGRYESLAPDEVNGWLRGFLPDKRGFILDVGAGSGRDAAPLSAPLSACLAAYFSPDPDLIPSCHSSNRLRSRQ